MDLIYETPIDRIYVRVPTANTYPGAKDHQRTASVILSNGYTLNLWQSHANLSEANGKGFIITSPDAIDALWETVNERYMEGRRDLAERFLEAENE